MKHGSMKNELPRWCNGLRARLECGRSWVLAQIGQTEDYKLGICCFSAEHGAFRRKSKGWLASNPDNVSEWGDMSIRGL